VSAFPIAYSSNPDLRSIVVCLEDAVREDEVTMAEQSFRQFVSSFTISPPTPLVFARPRDLNMLVRMLKMPGIEHVEGFVLPKVTTHSLPNWISILVHERHRFMPTIEGVEAFDRQAVSAMCDQLRPYIDRVAAVRIGGNDILNLFGVRRSRTRTAYEGPLGAAIRTIGSVFIPNGIAVAAPVFEHFTATDVLEREVEQDIEHGLLTKTAIHPLQIATIQRLYQPSANDMSEARAILDENARAVFGVHGSMCEPATHLRWAGLVLERAQIYGVANQLTTAATMVA
jgi:citrate lyase beta subunit